MTGHYFGKSQWAFPTQEYYEMMQTFMPALDKDYKRLIARNRWLKLRKAKLTEQPLCERCRESGKIRAATEVHHIVPVEDALTLMEKEALMYAPRNLRCLCHDCHVQTHTEMGRSGKAQVRRRAESQLERFRKNFM